ncbi:Mechanosensitive ion channel-domain-containing protein [Diplogelasinospora grovesii]|uniref:Mechanosensitive ion channel protein n=1 Tax=Diplogelasinospora grovesii TaxID=303347 RepID=A0AAN6NG52_9PEZI|nr:Mechanosensitive ion channel-domain-containing protein [Diplogelasinospora grovesii]
MVSPADTPPRLSFSTPQIALNVQVPTTAVPTPLEEQSNLNLTTGGIDTTHLRPDHASALSPSESREAANRLNDDLELLRAERVVSNQEHESKSTKSRLKRREHAEPVEDAFNTTGPAPATAALSGVAVPKKSTWLTKLWSFLRKFPRVLRYVVYAIPGGIIILVPVFLDLFAYGGSDSKRTVGGPGGVQLLWFGIWLEVIWLTFWAAKIMTMIMPGVFGVVAHAVGSSNHKKWKDIGRQLELSTALFLWLLAVLVSFYPILNDHRVLDSPDEPLPYLRWMDVVYKIIIAAFTLTTLNFVEKILIQWIAASFHLRTYSHRIHENRMQIDCLVALYSHAKTRLEARDPVWDGGGNMPSGARTPMKAIQENARQALSKVGFAANRMAGDLTGRRIVKGDHPRKVVLELLRNTASSHTLARVFYRTFVRPERDTIMVEDLQPAFITPEEADACFGVFDKDLNGDISMEELEMVCNEIHLEKKAIAASLKDLDSVIKKLDKVFMFIIVVIVIIVFISIISDSAAAALTSTGTFILGLSWLLQATAQEFLQSIIFVFVKHPFDVGDRVTVYGNTGSSLKGDDYYVQEVSLLYTEFKKMEGHVVQAPNSLLNTLFILNQRRSQGLADPVNLKLRFGTTEAQIEELKARMLEFCLQNKRDYTPKIISEVQTIDEVNSITMNIIFFHKSNFQNELLRLNRHNKFAVELMRQMREMGIEGPRLWQPGGMRDMPIYWSQVPQSQPPAYQATAPQGGGQGGEVGGGGGGGVAPTRSLSNAVLRQRTRGDSRAAMVDAPDFQDVYQGRQRGDTVMTRLASIRQSSREREDSVNVDRGVIDERVEGQGQMEKMHSQESESVSHTGGNSRRNITRMPHWPGRARRSSNTAASNV